MTPRSDVFKRYEKKYRLTPHQHQALTKALMPYMTPDSYGLHTISNLYFDTDSYELIRHSIEGPVYKEKLRLRSYGLPSSGDTVYIELKKKFDGVVYKRRVPMPLKDAQRVLTQGELPEAPGQILQEIHWFIRRFAPMPKVFIAYERLALYGNADPQLRITFDTGIRFRESLLDLSKGHWGRPLLPAGEVLMEIKIPGVMPLWLSQMLSTLSIYPSSFSKVGQCYKDHLIHTMNLQGGIHCA
jgi:hypothetical protein